MQIMLDSIWLSSLDEDEFSKQRRMLTSRWYTELEVDEIIEEEKEKEANRQKAIECYDKKENEINKKMEILTSAFERDLYYYYFKEWQNRTIFSDAELAETVNNDIWDTLMKVTNNSDEYCTSSYYTFWEIEETLFISKKERFIQDWTEEWLQLRWFLSEFVLNAIWNRKPTKDVPLLLRLEWTDYWIVVIYEDWKLLVWPYIF